MAVRGVLPLVCGRSARARLLTSSAARTVRGSTASIINIGARARIGQTSMAEAVLLGVPTLMGSTGCSGGPGGAGATACSCGCRGARAEDRRRLARLHRIESRCGTSRGRVRLLPARPLRARVRGGRGGRHAPRRVPRARRARDAAMDRPAVRPPATGRAPRRGRGQGGRALGLWVALGAIAVVVVVRMRLRRR